MKNWIKTLTLLSLNSFILMLIGVTLLHAQPSQPLVATPLTPPAVVAENVVTPSPEPTTPSPDMSPTVTTTQASATTAVAPTPSSAPSPTPSTPSNPPPTTTPTQTTTASPTTTPSPPPATSPAVATTPPPAPTPTPAAPTPPPSNQCIVMIAGGQYNVTTLRKTHSGGDVFQCGTDMTAIYQSQHGTSTALIAKYRI